MNDHMTDERLEQFCQEIGCSGLNKKCPGNPWCDIVIKVFGEPKKALPGENDE